MTATAEVRFGGDGQTTVQSYVRLTASTRIQCCTYDDAAPILSLHDGQVDIVITNPGQGQVTADDVTFGRLLADAVTRYAAELEDKLAAARDSEPGQDGTAGAGRVMTAQVRAGRSELVPPAAPGFAPETAEEVTRLCARS